MDMTAFRLNPVRPELLDAPAPRRFSDPVSDLNADLYDKARLLEQAVKMVDGLGLKIIAVEADGRRNNRIQVEHSVECNALEAVEVHRQRGWRLLAANRFGVEIRWVEMMEVAA